VPLDGVWPLAPSLDTIGPLATTIAGLVLGMQLIEPGFRPSPSPARTIGRLRTSARPVIEAAVDDALHAAGFDIVTLDWDDFDTGTNCFTTIFFNEVWDVDHELADNNPDGVGADITQVLGMADLFRPGLEDARRQLPGWRRSLLALFDQVELLALPTLPVFPPRLDGLGGDALVPAIIELTSHVSLFNAAGVPCTAQPVPVPGSHLPASLQLVGPPGGEELLLTTAQYVQTATS